MLSVTQSLSETYSRISVKEDRSQIHLHACCLLQLATFQGFLFLAGMSAVLTQPREARTTCCFTDAGKASRLALLNARP